MGKLVIINKDEALRLYKKFHRLGLSHKQQLDELRNSLRNNSMHGEFYLDTETVPYDKHQVYAISVTQGGKDGPTFVANINTHENPVKAALSWIIDRSNLNFGARDFQEKATLKARIHIHNLGYDLSQLIPYLTHFDTIEKGTNVYSARGKYIDLVQEGGDEPRPRSIELFFVDTLKLIPKALSEFGEMFKLDQCKEFMPHNMMTSDLVFKRKGIVSREKLLREVKGRGSAWAGKARKAVRARAAATAARSEADVKGGQALTAKAARLEERAREVEKEAEVEEEKAVNARDNRVTLFRNLERWGCEVAPGQYDIIKYSTCYCRIDTQVLKAGFEKFRDMILEGFAIDVHSHVSIASLADRYYQDEGVYRGVYELRGAPRDFIAQANVGGRVMMKGNSKHRFTSSAENGFARLADLDVVSLYPSAQLRLMEEVGGILMGKPKVWSKEIDLP